MNAQKLKSFFSSFFHLLATNAKKDDDSFLEKEDIVIVEKNDDFFLMKRYKVLIHNDNFTPMDFVVQILQQFFNKKVIEAKNITLLIHQTGLGVGGVYPKEIAETKLAQVQKEARIHGHPLRLSIEESE